MSKAVIGSVSEFIRWAIGSGNLCRFGELWRANVPRNLLLFETIQYVDLGAMYQGVAVVATGIYEYDTGRVYGLLAFVMLREVVARFKVQNRETLRNCEVEVEWLLDKDRRE